MTYIIGFLAFIFILGAAVVIHEFGHFAVAKLFGIRVETFSVGFGPRLFGRKWGQTDYRVSAIPLGGYVKLGGDESNAPIEGAGAEDIPPEEQFNLRPRWQRIAVALAGPIMNILTALTVSMAGAMIIGVPAEPSPVVTDIAQDGAAAKAGLQVGDHIVTFNGEENPSWSHISGDALLSPDHPLQMVVERNGQRIPLTITPTKQRTDTGDVIGDLDLRPDFGNWPVVVESVQQGMPAAEAGLLPGDQLVAINDVQVRDPKQVTQLIQANKNAPIRLNIKRNGEQKELTASVRESNGRQILGFSPGIDAPLQRINPAAAFGYSVHRNVEILRLTGKALGQFFSGQRSARDTISGPIGIARASSMAANEFGWAGIFSMLGFLSLNLGIFNLFPIPVLDGGAIFLLLLEAVLGLAGLTLSMTVRERIQQVGFVIVLLLMVLVITNDLMKEASRWRGSEDNKPAANAPAK